MSCIIYTDGSCLGNPGPGGWAAVILDDVSGEKKVISGPLPDTTNNQAELTAIYQALLAVPFYAFVAIYTDSQNAIGWLTMEYKVRSAKIRELCNAVWSVAVTRSLAVSYRHINGHGGNDHNEQAHNLASSEAAKCSHFHPL